MDYHGLAINDRFVLNEIIDADNFIKIYRALDKKKKNAESVIFIINVKIGNCRVDDLIRFKADLEAVRRIDHPAVAGSYYYEEIESGPFKGQFCVAMENIHGETLSSILSRFSGTWLSPQDSISIIKQICEALDALHSAGIIHHRIMPGFIMVDDKKKGNALKITLAGAGFSHIMNYIEGINSFTKSFQYMAPEESGVLKRIINESSDLYSVGIVLYRMLTGELPYTGDTISSILHKHVASAPVRPCLINPGIHVILERIILRLLNKEPAERYHTAWGLKSDLEYYNKNSVDEEFMIGERDVPIHPERRKIFIGRDQELKQLEEAITRVKGGKGSICLVEGESGSGKSRLIEEFRKKTGPSDIPLIAVKCYPGETVTPYNPIAEIITSYIKNLKNYPDIKYKTVTRQIRKAIGGAGSVLAGIIPGIREITGDYPDFAKIDPDREQKRFVMALQKTFMEMCLAESGLIVIMDDIHWMDDESYKVLRALSSLTMSSPLMLILTYRSEEVQKKFILKEYLNGFQDKGIFFIKILCSPLDNNDLRQFVSAILQMDSEAIEPVFLFVAARSRGNPYLTVEILEYLTNTGAVFFSNGNYCLNRKILDTVDTPDSLVHIILARIANLNDKDRFLITVMSAIGRKFHISLLFSIYDQSFSNSRNTHFSDGISREDLVKAVDNAVLNNFIYPDSSEKGLYKFTHDKIIEALHQNSGLNMLKAIHLLIAKSEAKLFEDGDDSVIFSLANHSIACGDADLITRYVVKAAIRASERFAYTEAIRLFSSVIKVLEKNSDNISKDITDLRSLCIRGIAEAQIVTGEYDNAIKAFRELLSTVGNCVEQALIYKQLCLAYFKKGDWQEVESCGERGLKLLGEKLPVKNISVVLSLIKEALKHFFTLLNKKAYNNSKTGAKADIYKIIIQFYVSLNWSYGLSNVIKFFRSVLRMLNLSMTKIGKSQELAISISGYASLCMIIPFFKKALKYHKTSLNIHEELNNKWGIGQSLLCLGYLYQWKGEYDISIDYLNKAINVFSEIGDTWEQGMSFHVLDLDYIYMGDYDRASDYIMKFINISEESGDSAGICGAYDDLLWINAEKGKIREGRKFGMKSISMSREYDLPFHACINNSHMGILSNVEGKYDEALVYLRRAEEQYRRTSFIRQYVTQIFPELAEAYIMKYLSPGGYGWDFLKKKIAAYKLCRTAIRKTKPWITHYGDALRVFALYFLYSGKYKLSERYFRKCLAFQKRLNRRYKLARGLLDYGAFLNMAGRSEKAAISLNNASRIFSEIGCEFFRDKALNELAVNNNSNIAPGMMDLINKMKYEQAASVAQEIKTINNHEELFDLIFNRCMEITGAQRGFYFSRKGDYSDIELVYSNTIKNTDKEFLYTEIIKNTISSAKVSINIINPERPDENTGFNKSVNKYYHSFICVPVITGGKAIGACYFDNVLAPGLSDQEDAGLIVTIISQAAPLISIEQYGTHLQTENFYSNTSGNEDTATDGNNKKLGLSIKEDGKYHIIPYDNILYVLSSGRNAIIYTDNKTYKAGLLLAKIEKMLPKNIFIRIHKQYIINMNYISYIEYYLGNRYAVHLADEDDTVLFSGRSYSSQLKTRVISQ